MGTNTKCIVLLVLVIQLSNWMTPHAEAMPITFAFEGPLYSGLPGVQTFSGSYTFESATQASIVTPSGAFYPALLSLTIAAGSSTWSLSPNGDNGIFVTNGPGFTGDGYGVRARVTGSPVGGVSEFDFYINFVDYTGTRISNIELPVTFSPIGFDRYFQLAGPLTSYDVIIKGGVLSLTPIPLPPAALLFASGLVALLVKFRTKYH